MASGSKCRGCSPRHRIPEGFERLPGRTARRTSAFWPARPNRRLQQWSASARRRVARPHPGPASKRVATTHGNVFEPQSSPQLTFSFLWMPCITPQHPDKWAEKHAAKQHKPPPISKTAVWQRHAPRSNGGNEINDAKTNGLTTPVLIDLVFTRSPPRLSFILAHAR